MSHMLQTQADLCEIVIQQDGAAKDRPWRSEMTYRNVEARS